MATILKCKMCGGDISVNADMTVGTCQYCGSTMTLPHIDTDKKARLFNHANQYRLNNEFDKAYDAYKAISEEDDQEAEAYWGMLLSEYGVEYVEDPKTKKRVPTCHRTIIHPIKKSSHYELACKYADIENRFMYQNEAELLDKIQKKIMSISSQQEQYDVFICYKETEDSTSERTPDSVLAQEIFDELSKKGINTFFSRISLKDKIGEDYEPSIYSALKTAKVMIVVTTSSEHCESPWVRNEWSRFIAFMSEDADKKIVPAFKEMTAYELPDELSAFQAQDMGKLGAIQDLVLGVESLLRNKDNTKKTMSEQDVLSIVKEKEERERQAARAAIEAKTRKSLRFVLAIAVALLVVFGVVKVAQYINSAYIKPSKIYKAALVEMENEDYTQAMSDFSKIKGFKDSNELYDECSRQSTEKKVSTLLTGTNYSALAQAVSKLDITKCEDTLIEGISAKLLKLLSDEDIENAVFLADSIDSAKLSTRGGELKETVDNVYKAQSDKTNQKRYETAEENYSKGSIRGYKSALNTMIELSEASYSDSQQRTEIMMQGIYKEADNYFKRGQYKYAKENFDLLAEYKYSDSEARSNECDNIMSAEGKELNAKIVKINGTWKKNSRQKIVIEFTVSTDNTITCRYQTDNSSKWIGEYNVIYREEPDTFQFTWLSKQMIVTLSGEEMTINCYTWGDNMLTGTYSKLE